MRRRPLDESVQHVLVCPGGINVLVDVVRQFQQFGIRESNATVIRYGALDLEDDVEFVHSEHRRKKSEHGGCTRNDDMQPSHQINRIRLVRKESIGSADNHSRQGNQIKHHETPWVIMWKMVETSTAARKTAAMIVTSDIGAAAAHGQLRLPAHPPRERLLDRMGDTRASQVAEMLPPVGKAVPFRATLKALAVTHHGSYSGRLGASSSISSRAVTGIRATNP